MRKAGPPREIPPPLELECLKTLWDLGEGNVRQVRAALEPGRPLAYTTILTLLERLARKGVVARRKVGRSFHYAPVVQRDALRRLALQELLNGYFGGSEAELLAYLSRRSAAPLPDAPPLDDGLDPALL